MGKTIKKNAKKINTKKKPKKTGNSLSNPTLLVLIKIVSSILMSTHNIGFGIELGEIEWHQSPLIWSSGLMHH